MRRISGSYGVSVVALSVFLMLVMQRPARAHFYIDYPDSGLYSGPSPMPWMTQDSLGSPQKLGPCGNEGGGTATGAVTPFAAGQTVMLQWTEVVSHHGWFRIALAPDRSAFQDPSVQVTAGGLSADASVENPPVAPVLVDGLYPHAMGAVPHTYGPYALKLPATACAHCTLQIIQVMLDHPSNLDNLPDGAVNPDGFLYHHCIDISIAAPDGGIPEAVDGGGAGATDAGSPGASTSDASIPEATEGGAPGASSTGTQSSVGASDSSSAGSSTTGTVARSPSAGCSCTTTSVAPGNDCAWAAIAVGAAAFERRRRRRAHARSLHQSS